MLELTTLLRGRRYRTAVELEFQDDVEAVLKSAKLSYIREYQLTTGPIDFYLPETRQGIECKVKGSPTAVLGQLLRYANEEPVSALLCLTSKRNHAWNVETLAGKPFESLWVGNTF